MTELNPYAPPEITEDRPQWKREGDFILVREGSSLPPIDLESGSETCLVSVKRHFISRSTVYQLANIFVPMSLFPLTEMNILSLPIVVVLSSLIAIAMWALPRWSALRLSFIIAQSVQFEYFREGSRRYALKRHLLKSGLMIALVILIGGLATYVFRDTFGSLVPMVTTAILSYVLYIATKRKPTKLFMIPAPEGWVKIGGVHRDVLDRLERMAQSPES